MKLEVLKRAVTTRVGRQILTTQKHSPTLLFAGGVVGVVATTVLACRATLKLEEVLDEAERDRTMATELRHKSYSEQDRVEDLGKIKLRTAAKVVKLYAPAVGVGVLSIGLLTGSHVQLTRRNTAVMAAYTALDKGFKEYRDRVREELGDEKDLEFRHGTTTVTEVVETKDGPQEVEKKYIPAGVPSIYAKFFDEGSKNWSRQPEYNYIFLNAQQNYANDLLQTRGHVFLNEVYDSLGLPRTKAGAVVGWILSRDGDNFIDFGIFNGHDERKRAFVNGPEKSVLLDFNVDGTIYHLLDEEA